MRKNFIIITIFILIIIILSSCTIYHPFSKWENESTEILKTIVFNNKIYIFGIVKKRKKLFKTKYNENKSYKKVYEHEVNYENCIKYTIDGNKWKNITKKAKWSNAKNITPIVFKNKLFIFENTLNHNDKPVKNIWYSKNGKIWNKVYKNIPYEYRQKPKYFVFKNKIWMVGGEKSSELIDINIKLNDIWFSNDGKTWELLNNNSLFLEKNDPKHFFEFKNNIFAISKKTNSIWKSKDGYNWGKYIKTDSFFDSNCNEIFSFENEVIVFGKNEIWKSDNCKDWKLVGGEYEKSFSEDIPNIYYNNKYISIKSQYKEIDILKYKNNLNKNDKKYHDTVIFNEKIYSIGSNKDDIYVSDDFMKWNKIMDIDLSSDTWMKRNNKKLIIYNKEMWIIGGSRPYGKWKDCWSTSDGYNWNKLSDIFNNKDHVVKDYITFRNKLWIFDESNNLWSTDKGYLWQKYNDIPYENSSQIQIMNNNLFMISQKNNIYSIWKSKYGHKWDLIKDNINIVENSAKKKYFYEFNNFLFYINYDNNFKKNNKVWYSKDGIEWNKINYNPDWLNKINKCYIYKKDDMIWVLGVNKKGKKDGQLWYTQDYKKWKKAANIPKLGKIKSITSKNIWFYKDKIWIIDNQIPIDAKNIWVLDKDFNSTHIKLYIE